MKEKELDCLRQKMLADESLRQLRGTGQLVFGEGNPDSQIVFIGEAPGAEEDRLGRPFVGRAGRLLDSWLAEIGLLRSEVWITNLVKHRPPDNRDPLPQEAKIYGEFLIEEIGIISPIAIVTLGRHAGKHFLPQLSISSDHGSKHQLEFYSGESFDLYPFYHPAALLYNPSLKESVGVDLQKLKESLLNV